MNVCACGCGSQVNGTWVRGHNAKRGQSRGLEEQEKTCVVCGATFHRTDPHIVRQSNQHWRTRRCCSHECAVIARTHTQRGQIRVEDATPDAGRMRARRMYPGPLACEQCGAPAERHHRDGNTLNNRPENVAFLCRTHHINEEDRMAYRRVDKTTPEYIERRRAQARERSRRYRARKAAA